MIITLLVDLGIKKYHQTRSNPEESMPLGMMVALDHMNQFRDVAKLKYAYVGQRSRSKVGHA